MYVYSILISLYISLMDVNDTSIWGIKIDQSDYILKMVIDIHT
jgi:hypothetical protein